MFFFFFNSVLFSQDNYHYFVLLGHSKVGVERVNNPLFFKAQFFLFLYDVVPWSVLDDTGLKNAGLCVQVITFLS